MFDATLLVVLVAPVDTAAASSEATQQVLVLALQTTTGLQSPSRAADGCQAARKRFVKLAKRDLGRL